MCGTLVEINNKEENQFIYSVIQERVVENFRFWIGLESRNGINYEWQSKNTTESNRFDDWKEGNPNDIGVDTCAFMWSLKWYDTYRSQCKRNDEYFICESRFD
ncbi:hepatic lectin-like [Mytilus galloprovincialis]|uniref:hepatic lectin-like n=1 Tax=Mytilus galloprovincialis TaxID=29158 RepID=UPI003F7BAEA6